jgi:hypothetical protein
MLNPDDMSVGQYVTITKNWHKEDIIQNIGGSQIGSKTLVIGSREVEDKSWYGEILKVKAVNLPFLVLEVLSSDSKGKVMIKDIRNTNFIKVTQKYRNALKKYRNALKGK